MHGTKKGRKVVNSVISFLSVCLPLFPHMFTFSLRTLLLSKLIKARVQVCTDTKPVRACGKVFIKKKYLLSLVVNLSLNLSTDLKTTISP